MFTVVFVCLIFGGALKEESLPPISSFFSESDLRTLEEAWGDVSIPKLLTAEDFLKGLYMEAFIYKILEAIQSLEVQRSLEKRSGVSEQLSLSREFISKNRTALYGSAIVKWFFEGEKLILLPGERSDAEHYRMSVETMPINDTGILITDKKNRTMTSINNHDLEEVVFLPAEYDFLASTLRVEKRIKLPAALWIVVLIHEKRHGLDYILTLQKRWAFEEPSATDFVDFEIVGASMGLAAWKILKKDFLKKWSAKSPDDDPDKVFAYAYINYLEEAEEVLNNFAGNENEANTTKAVRFFWKRINWK